MAIEWDETVETKRRVRLALLRPGSGATGTVCDATIDDLRRACEAAGLVVETVERATADLEDRTNLREAYQKLADELDACLDALSEHVSPDGTVTTPRMVRPSSVLAGIRALQGRLRDARSDLREHDAALEQAVERAEKAEAELRTIEERGGALREAAASVRGDAERMPTLEADLAAARARIAELEAPMPEATVEELVGLHRRVFEQHPSGWSGEARLDAIRAVAERVRRERCLIARAVAGGVGFELWQQEGDIWKVRIGIHGKITAAPAAEVPAELARMLTEVGA